LNRAILNANYIACSGAELESPLTDLNHDDDFRLLPGVATPRPASPSLPMLPCQTMTQRRIGLWLLAAAFAFSLTATGCKRPAAPPAPPPPMVTVSTPLDREVTDWDEYTGHLVSPETANIAARISGIIVAAPFKEGALVKKDDVLFVIDDRPFRADLENKKANVAKDQAQL